MKIKDDLSGLFQELRDAAPNARIVALGYPDLFPSGLLVDMESSDCGAMALFGKSYLLTLEDHFNEVAEDAASQHGVEFVPTRRIFEGHEPCGAIQPRWLQFATTNEHYKDRKDPGNFHPTLNGQAALARTVTCHLILRPDPSMQYSEDYLDDLTKCAKFGRYPSSG